MPRPGIILFAGWALLAAIPPSYGQTSKPTVDGVVVKTDSSSGKITLRHGEIANLHMQAMTMVFAVRDAAMLNGLKAGDTVRFAAEEVNGIKTVTEIERAK